MPDEPTSPSETAPLVKCADCGFLTLRNDYTGQLDEVGDGYRRTGEPQELRKPQDPSDRSNVYPLSYTFYYKAHTNLPICFAREWNLFGDLVQSGNNAGDASLEPGLALEVITKDRLCSAFTPWQQGFTPKEHREMLDRQALLRWQSEREDADQQFRKEMQDAQLAAQDKIDERRFRAEQGYGWRLARFGAAVALVAAVVGAGVSAAVSPLVDDKPTVNTTIEVPTQQAPIINIIVPTPESR
jgi:hypothetical protein